MTTRHSGGPYDVTSRVRAVQALSSLERSLKQRPELSGPGIVATCKVVPVHGVVDWGFQELFRNVHHLADTPGSVSYRAGRALINVFERNRRCVGITGYFIPATIRAINDIQVLTD